MLHQGLWNTYALGTRCNLFGFCEPEQVQGCRGARDVHRVVGFGLAVENKLLEATAYPRAAAL